MSLEPVEMADERQRENAEEIVQDSGPAAALTAASVDLVKIIREGIPERRYVPGCEPWLPAGKRCLMPAPAGTGKTLAAITIAVSIVRHGGAVAIIDVENGAEEYAARLADVLGDRDWLAAECIERLFYYWWPALKTTWPREEWAKAHAGIDLVVFDSSRLVLSGVGLSEDKNDDYATFVSALLVPLAHAGTATLVLDNTGWEDRERARGASAKYDLNEVVYVAKVGKPFDRDRAGELRLIRKRQRFSGLPAELRVELGGGIYRAPVVIERPADSERAFRPTGYMRKVSRTIEDNPGLSRKDVLALTGGKHDYSSPALTLLVEEGYVRVEPDGREKRHYSVRPYWEDEDA